MRASLPGVAVMASNHVMWVAVYCVSLIVAAHEDAGYFAELGYQDDAIDVVNVNATCPTDSVLRTRDTCTVDGVDVECIKLRCCENHVYISGRCISNTVDPCSLQLCEQACSVHQDRMWCTCHPGYQFNPDNYHRKTQPYCEDMDECAFNNGGCSHTCINDPGRHHCVCPPHHTLTSDGRRCELQRTLAPAEPMALLRAPPRCYSSCDTVARLSRKVEQLTEQLHSTQNTLKRVLSDQGFRGEGEEDRFAEGTFMHRVLDSTAPLEGGYCRCERGPRGPPGAQGMEGSKGSRGPRGPRGTRGPRSSLDLMLLMLADLKHDINNLEKRVYADGKYPERFNLQKAWRYQRKQEQTDQERNTEQELQAFTAPSIEATTSTLEVIHNSVTGEIPREFESTTDWTLVKGETASSELDDLRHTLSDNIDTKLKEFYLLVNSTITKDDDEEEDDFSDYAFY